MKRSLIIINILSLFLTSCAAIRPQAERVPAADSTCQEMIKAFFQEEKNDSMGADLKAFLKIDTTDEETSDFFKEFSDSKLSTLDEDTLRAIFLYGKEDASVRRDLLKEFHHQISGSDIDENNKAWEKFAAHKRKVDDKKQKMIAKEETVAGKKAASEKAQIFEKLYYRCKTQIQSKPTPLALKQAKHLTYAIMAGSFGSSVISYSTVHRDEEKNKKWFNELFFTLGIDLMFNYIGGRFVLTNPNLNPWKGKMPMAFLSSTLSDVGVSGAYALFFKPDNSELEKKLKALEKDPKAQKKLQELLKIAEENNLYEKHLKNTQDLFKDKRTGKSMNPADFDHEVTIEDIDIEESRELLLAALAEQEYQENSGMMQMGHPAVDRFTYHRIFSLINVPTTIGMTMLMHNQMCMTEDPKKGFMKAVGLFLGTSMLMDTIYFNTKEELINQ
jgi:hypothetical protein